MGFRQIVTIDGPAGVGKSTVSRLVAAALDYTYLDTGAMYRGVACFLQKRKIAVDDLEAVSQALEELQLELYVSDDKSGDVGVRICGEDVSEAIRTPEMSMAASAVSRLPVVRQKLTTMQQDIGRRGRIVAEGRDTGTVVFPDAAYKFFLDAAPEERARRRVEQLRLRGEYPDEQEILALTVERDKNDRERAIAPLRQAEDALLIDTTSIDVDEVCRRILARIGNVSKS